MTDQPVHYSPNVEAARRHQKAYRERRRLWAAQTGRPYPEDGGEASGRGKGAEEA